MTALRELILLEVAYQTVLRETGVDHRRPWFLKQYLLRSRGRVIGL